jgi:RimJ/RimL family protein N-acetyltransferase
VSPPQIGPLRECDLPDLAAAIRTDEVYAHIGGKAPSLEAFTLGLQRALAGPPEHRKTERWLNYLVRDADSAEMLGRLEATLHDGIAEVAFLFSARVWGRGYASYALNWLHSEIVQNYGAVPLWATTVPENVRCQALLRRAGYAQVEPAAAPRLLTYGDGDLVFTLRSAI